MPVYTYRREDGSTFDYRQKFSDEPLTTDPETGQKVTRLVQAAGVIFKGSGFYVTDNKGSSGAGAKPGKAASETTSDKPAAATETTSSTTTTAAAD